jgi:DNA-binding GntR family transcriptional regulator
MPLFRLAIQGLTVSDTREQWIRDHENILTALIEGDARRAGQLALKSVREARDAILARISQTRPSRGCRDAAVTGCTDRRAAQA